MDKKSLKLVVVGDSYVGKTTYVSTPLPCASFCVLCYWTLLGTLNKKVVGKRKASPRRMVPRVGGAVCANLAHSCYISRRAALFTILSFVGGIYQVAFFI